MTTLVLDATQFSDLIESKWIRRFLNTYHYFTPFNDDEFENNG